MGNLGNLLESNHETLYALHSAGIRNIETALDYVQINKLFKSYDHIKSKTKRKELISERMGVSKRTVDNALTACKKLV